MPDGAISQQNASLEVEAVDYEDSGFCVSILTDGTKGITPRDSYVATFCARVAKLSKPAVKPVATDIWPLDMFFAADKRRIENIKEQMEDPDVNRFVTWLQANDPEKRAAAEARLKRGVVAFEDLPVLFNKGDEVIFDADQAIAGVIENATLRSTMFSRFCEVEVGVIHNLGCTVSEGTYGMRVPFFKGVISVDDLPVRRITKAEKDRLSERGTAFRRYATGAHYLSYTGHLVREGYWFDTSYRADGRVMIDMVNLTQIEPNFASMLSSVVGISWDNDRGDRRKAKESQGMEIADADLWRCWPYLYGFSLSAKIWGRFEVASLKPVNFRKDAFDKLVMDPDRKQMLRALVEHSEGSFSDIIDGKGGGLIFLLHGKPGLGKTLSAEAVAETLERPLYMVSVGELGTDPSTLESSLRKILDVATSWNAVVLLDEADIFLEARDQHNIERNAMVGIFLRLLEYHQGVLFLTTNRVTEFDEAFHSRISLALSFPGMETEERARVWSNLLDAAGITDIDAEELAGIEINGRQIKNAIRLAQTLARAEGTPVTIEHLKKPIGLQREFVAEVTGQTPST